MASETRLFVGRLGHNMRERDLHDLFIKYGRIVNCSMKTTYGFVEFENPRDARDAVNGMDGYRLDGSRIAVEFSKGRGESFKDRDRGDRDRDGRDRGSRGGDRDRDRDRRRDERGYGGGSYEGRRGSGRYSPPYNSEYRITINNLPTGCSWQDLKDHFRQAGDVCFSDVRRSRDGHEVGVVEFKNYEDMREAVRRFDRTRLRGSTITIVCEYDGKRASVSRSPRRRASPSRSRSPRRSRSRSPRHSASRSPRKSSPARLSPSRKSPPARGSSPSPGRTASASPEKPNLNKSPDHSRSPRSQSRSPEPTE